jgi:hypothetical protein
MTIETPIAAIERFNTILLDATIECTKSKDVSAYLQAVDPSITDPIVDQIYEGLTEVQEDVLFEYISEQEEFFASFSLRVKHLSPEQTAEMVKTPLFSEKFVSINTVFGEENANRIANLFVKLNTGMAKTFIEIEPSLSSANSMLTQFGQPNLMQTVASYLNRIDLSGLEECSEQEIEQKLGDIMEKMGRELNFSPDQVASSKTLAMQSMKDELVKKSSSLSRPCMG